jgi:outer membrane receptor protein involved in Fe transport
LYLKFDRGLKSGGFNPTLNLLPGENESLVNEEIHNIFEIGTKGTYLGGALTLNSAVFWNAVTDMQLNKIIGLASQTFNTDVNVSGLELEAVFVPNEYSRFNFTGAINTSELDGYEDYDPRNPYGVSSVDLSTIGESQGVVFGMTDVGMIYRSLGSTCNQPFNALLGPACPNTGFNIQDLTGRKLPGVPDMSFSIGGEVDLMNNDNGLLTARLDYIYRGDFYLTVFNNEHELVDEFDFMNVDLTYQSPDGKWMVDFYVHNIEDKDIVTGAFIGSQSNGGGYNLYLQEPMNGGISIQYNF